MLCFSKLCFWETGEVKKNTVRIAVFWASAAVVCILYYIANSFFVLERIYRMSFLTDPSRLRQVTVIKHSIEAYNFAVIITAFAVPYASLIRNYTRTPIRFKKKQYKVIAAVTAMLDALLLLLLIGGPYRNTVNVNLFVNSSYEIQHWHIVFYTLLPIIFLVLLTVIYVLLRRYDVLT